MQIEELGRFHHVGIACEDIEVARDWVHRFFRVARDSGVVWDELQAVHLCMIEASGVRIELVSGAPVENFVTRGHFLYHMCYETMDIDDSLRSLESGGCLRISGPTPAKLFQGRRVAFVLGPLGIIELLERS